MDALGVLNLCGDALVVFVEYFGIPVRLFLISKKHKIKRGENTKKTQHRE
jgi:hypothetical protein